MKIFYALLKIFYTVLFILILTSFAQAEKVEYDMEGLNFRQLMRDFVIGLSDYSKTINPDFIIIPQNGIELITIGGNSRDLPALDYLNAVNGIGQEELFYGYYGDDEPTPQDISDYLLGFLNIAESNNLEVLIIDYCSSWSNINDSHYLGNINGFITFAADSRGLNTIPEYPDPVYNYNESAVNSLADAENFLYIINADEFQYKDDFINTIEQTNYDIIIIDLFFHGYIMMSPEEVEALKIKPSGGKRLVLAYMSIGEAEDYRYYWRSQWKYRPPIWLGDENPYWEGNYKVYYWEPEWQKIIFGTENSYLDKILRTGFDGVYLDIIDAFHYYEAKSR